MVVFQSANKNYQQEKTDTKTTCRRGSAYRETRTYLRDSPLKKKNVHTSWAVPPLLLGCVCFPFRNATCDPVSSLLSFMQPQSWSRSGGCVPAVRPKCKCNQACLWSTAASALVNSTVLPGQPAQRCHNLAAGTELPFRLLTARFLRQLISHPCL